jgi:hypothetical protein
LSFQHDEQVFVSHGANDKVSNDRMLVGFGFTFFSKHPAKDLTIFNNGHEKKCLKYLP